jgi:hypothetical protein
MPGVEQPQEPVKLSRSGICHAPGSTYYLRENQKLHTLPEPRSLSQGRREDAEALSIYGSYVESSLGAAARHPVTNP